MHCIAVHIWCKPLQAAQADNQMIRSGGDGETTEPARQPHRKGLLLGKTPDELKAQGIDVSDSRYTAEDLFGTLSGSSFLDAVYESFGAGEYDVSWFTAGERSIDRSPLSRPIQHATAESYKARILREGLSQLASGNIGVCQAICVISYVMFFCYGLLALGSQIVSIS